MTDDIDIARGDMLVSPTSRPEVSDQFAAHVIWMSDHALVPGRSYLARIGTRKYWLPGMDVVHDEHGQGWVWGSGRGVVTVRFETAAASEEEILAAVRAWVRAFSGSSVTAG